MVRSLPKTFALERGNDWQRTMLMCCTHVAHQLEACNAQGLHSWLLDSQEASEASEFLPNPVVSLPRPRLSQAT